VNLGPVVSVKTAAKYLGISEVTVKRRIREGKLKAYKDGGYWRIKREWLDEYQNNLIRECLHEKQAATV